MKARRQVDTGDMLFGRRTRQNHALEHATVTLLSQTLPELNASARSNARGFIIFADIPLDEVRHASDEALKRLQAGESELAIHPNCGTNVAVGLSVMIVGSLLALTALRPRTRVATVAAGSVAGLAVARPVGTLMQRYVTTLPDVHDIRLRSVRRRRFFGRWVIEVQTETASNAG
ncbi:MAG TPA: DUF6391 domain-containing protein [Ktedonobacterales bacterium]|jgi:hypothetical protein